jgi:hypothetical protein
VKTTVNHAATVEVSGIASTAGALEEAAHVQVRHRGLGVCMWHGYPEHQSAGDG